MDPHPDATVSSRSLCAASGPEPPPRKVLIVGRAYRRRDRLDALLTEAGFTLAAHVPDAHVRAELPASLVLLDGWAAAGEGLSLLRALVDADEPSRCPCLLLASEVREAGPRIAAAQAGCDEVVSADLEPEAIVAWALRAAARPAERDDGRTPARLLLLMGVGDERSALHEALTGAGYDAFTAETTEEGLRRAALVRPDLVIVDDDLRPERGLDAVRLLRRHPELSCAQYLLLASGDTSADEVEALSTGVEGYVRKELGTPSLLARVARLLRGRGPQRTDLAAPWRLVLLDGGAPAGDSGAAWTWPTTSHDDVTRATTLAEVLALLDHARVDALLIDPDRGPLAACEVAQAVRRTGMGRDLLVLAAVGEGALGDVFELTEAGIDDCLVKTADAALGRARLESHLRRRAREVEARRVHEARHQRELAAAEARAALELAETRAELLIRLEARNADLYARSTDLAEREQQERERAEAALGERALAQASLEESEERFGFLAAQLNEVFWVSDLVASRFLYLSPAADQVFGFPAEEGLRELAAWERAIHPDDRKRTLAAFGAIEAGDELDEEFRVLHPDGRVRLVHMRGHALRNASGRVHRAVGLAEDVTDARRREDALRSTEERFQRAVRGTSDGLWEWDLRTGDVWYSPRYRELLGRDEHDFPDRLESLFEALHPDDHELVHHAVRTHLEEEQPYDVELRLRHADGAHRWFRMRGSATRDPGGAALLVSGSIQDRTERRGAEEALRASEDKYRRLAQNLPGKFFLYTRDGSGAFSAASASLEDVLGYSPGAPLPRLADLLTEAEVNQRARAILEQIVAGAHHPRYEAEVRHRSGELRWLEISEVPVFDADGVVVGVEGIAKDLTEERALAARRQHANRLEAVGRLAGGVAHDSNNMLSVILGYSDLALELLEPSHPAQVYLERIRAAGRKSAELTRKLLSFSRKQVLSPQVVPLDRLLDEVEPLITQLVGESVQLQVRCPAPAPAIRADPGQLEQVIVNLAANARDAMPRGGKLTIEAARVSVDADYAASHADARVGDYVLLAVSDTGSGMDRETLAHVFEPFFTTKDHGQGTGLGLASTHGFVRQSGGFILAYSELGHGTTFKLHFPAVAEEAAPGQQERASEAAPARGTERVLLVEDEPLVRSLALEALTAAGFQVTAPEGAEEAAVQCEEGPEFDLILTDVVMPGLSGPELVSRARRAQPGIKVIFMSGYAETAVALHGLLEPGAQFLGKPITPGALTRKVRAVLDGPRTSRLVRDRP